MKFKLSITKTNEFSSHQIFTEMSEIYVSINIDLQGYNKIILAYQKFGSPISRTIIIPTMFARFPVTHVIYQKFITFQCVNCSGIQPKKIQWMDHYGTKKFPHTHVCLYQQKNRVFDWLIVSILLRNDIYILCIPWNS